MIALALAAAIHAPAAVERGTVEIHVAGSSGYEATVWFFERRDYDRVAALAGRPPLGR